MTSTTTDTKPSGPAAAAILAAGIGCFYMGLITTLDEVAGGGSGLDNFLKFDANYGIGKGVGPLSGKTITTVAVFVVAWAILGVLLRGKEVRFQRFFVATIALVVLGFALTFPPVFDAIKGG